MKLKPAPYRELRPLEIVPGEAISRTARASVVETHYTSRLVRSCKKQSALLLRALSATLLSQRLQFRVLDIKVGINVLDVFVLVKLVHQPEHLVRGFA